MIRLATALLRSILIIPLATMSMSCSREVSEVSSVFLQVPSAIAGLVGSANATPSGKLCFAVNITGSGINTDETPKCGPTLGVYAGFVGAGQSLELNVPKGVSRTITLLLYVASEGSACPDFAQASRDRRSLFAQTYQVAVKSTDTSGPTTVVDMTAVYPGKANTLLTALGQTSSCTGALPKTYLLSNGDAVVAASGTVLSDSPSIPDVFSFFQQAAVSFYLTTSAQIYSNSTSRTVSPIFVSVTQKPDTRKLYGHLVDGTIVEVGNDGEPLHLTPDSCPFSSCAVPPWFQSVTASAGIGLYGIDHGGNMYTVAGDGSAILTPQSIPLHVQQVSF